MKNTRLNSILASSVIACALAVGSLVSTQTASAQNNMVKVTIPFDFQTGSQTLPAGTYRVHRESPDVIRLEGPGRASGMVIMYSTTKTKAADYGMLVFDLTGGKYFLHQVWAAGATNGLECTKSNAEKAALVATNKEDVTSIEVAFDTAPLK